MSNQRALTMKVMGTPFDERRRSSMATKAKLALSALLLGMLWTVPAQAQAPAPTAPSAPLAHDLTDSASGTGRTRRRADRDVAVVPGRRGGGLPGRHRTGRFRRLDLHRGSGRDFLSARVRRAAHRHPDGWTHCQRVHRPAWLDEIARGDRRDPGSRPRPHRTAGVAAGARVAHLAAAAEFPGHACRHRRRRHGLHLRAGHYAGDVPVHAARQHRGAALPGRHGQGAGVRVPDRSHRLSGRFSSQRQRPVGRRAHHLQRGSIHLRGDPGRRDRRPVLHGDGMVSAPMGTSDAREVLIEVRNLINRFGVQTVHDHLDLDVHRGEILGVVGGSGSGKSVLLRSIVGLLRPTSGSVRVFGEDLLALPAARRSLIERRFGVLFQRGALFSSLTVAENVALPLIEHGGLDRDDATHIAGVKLALAGLPRDAAHKPPSELSGGMIKRAALARALALDPEILFLDEPTAGLDPISAAAFDQLLLTLRNALGLTVFLVTHDLDTLYTVCDRVAVISQKKVLVAGPLDVVAATDDAWVQAYFHGPRGRAAEHAAQRLTEKS